MTLLPTLLATLFGLGLLVGVLVFTAAFTLVERKLMGLHQRREGPDRVGFEGMGQPFADGLKLLRKETLRPKDTPEGRVFLLAPLLSLWVSLLLWAFLPLSAAGALFNGEVGLLLVLGLSSLGSYGVIYAGWASNNKYALLGAFRAVAQFISYEILFSLLFLPLIGATASVSLVSLVEYQALGGWFAYLVPLWLLSFLVVLAETNRTPFDLPEAEAELVAGFNVEYSSLLFAFFFLAEYSGMGFFGGLLASLFFGGWSGWPLGGSPPPSFFPSPAGPEGLGWWVGAGWWGSSLPSTLPTLVGGVGVVALKVQLLCAAFILVRAALPRHRFDQLIQLCWKYLFPLVVGLVVLVVGIQYAALLGALAPPPSGVAATLLPSLPPPGGGGPFRLMSWEEAVAGARRLGEAERLRSLAGELPLWWGNSPLPSLWPEAVDRVGRMATTGQSYFPLRPGGPLPPLPPDGPHLLSDQQCCHRAALEWFLLHSPTHRGMTLLQWRVETEEVLREWCAQCCAHRSTVPDREWEPLPYEVELAKPQPPDSCYREAPFHRYRRYQQCCWQAGRLLEGNPNLETLVGRIMACYRNCDNLVFPLGLAPPSDLVERCAELAERMDGYEADAPGEGKP